MTRNHYIIIPLLLFSSLLSQDIYRELDKYHKEIDLSNSHRLLDQHLAIAIKYNNHGNISRYEKIYSELYGDEYKNLLKNAVGPIKPKSWWQFAADRDDTLQVVKELEKIYIDHSEDYVLNLLIGDLFFQIENFQKAKPYLMIGADLAARYVYMENKLIPITNHYLAALHFKLNDIDQGFLFLEKSFINGYSDILHLENCQYLNFIEQDIPYKDHYDNLLNKYLVKNINDVFRYLRQSVSAEWLNGDETKEPLEINSIIDKCDKWGAEFEKAGNLSIANDLYIRADLFRSRLAGGVNDKDLNYISNNGDKIILNYDKLGQYERAGAASEMKAKNFSDINDANYSIRTEYLELAYNYRKKSGNRIEVANIAKYLGDRYSSANNVNEAINYYNVALYIHTENKDSLSIPSLYTRIYDLKDISYKEYGAKALEFIEEYEGINFDPRKFNKYKVNYSSLMVNLANENVQNLKYKTAAKYNNELLGYCLMYKEGCSILDSLGVALNYLEILWEASDVIDKELLDYFFTGYEKRINELENDSSNFFYLFAGYFNLSGIYGTDLMYDPAKAKYYSNRLSLLSKTKNDDFWYNYRQKTKDLRENLYKNNEWDLLIDSYDDVFIDDFDLGNAWIHKNEPEKAKEYFKKGIVKSQKKDDISKLLDNYRSLAKLAILQQNNDDLQLYINEVISLIDDKDNEEARADQESIILTNLSLSLRDRYTNWYDLSLKYDYINENYADFYINLYSNRAYWLKRNILIKSLMTSSLDENEVTKLYTQPKNQVFIGFDIISESNQFNNFQIRNSLLEKYIPKDIDSLYLEKNILCIYFYDQTKYATSELINKAGNLDNFKNVFNTKEKDWWYFELIPTDSIFSEYNGIQNALKIYRNQLSTNDPNAKILAAKFYQTLIKPIETLISNYNDLVIIPDHNFTYLPFETLINKEGDPLIDDFTISYIQSQVLFEFMMHAGNDQKIYEYDFLGIGGAIYDDTNNNLKYRSVKYLQNENNIISDYIDRSNLSDLPGSKKEVSDIGALFDNSRTFIGKMASEETLKDFSGEGWLKKYKYIHFATHGRIDLDNPDRSAIVLSQDKKSTEFEDGYLTVGEIVDDLELSGNIITLSACKTKAGKKYGSEGVIGLNEAFLSAGAKGVCSTLWDIPDKPTSLFMLKLYEKISKGTDYRIALSETKRDFLNGDYGKEYSGPSIWAPFVYYGM